MSDLFGKEISNERKRVEKLLDEQKGKMKDVKAVRDLAKKYNVDTTDLDVLIKAADRVLGIDESKPKPEANK